MLLGAAVGEAQGATLSAEVDRNELVMGEYVTFKLSLLNSDTRLRAEGVSPNVDLTLLSDDFELGVPRAENRFNIQRSRGRSTSSITIELFPRQPGELTIPSFQVDGLSSDAITISARPRPLQPAPEVFIRSGASTTTPWLGEQVTAYLDIYHRIAIDSARLGADPEFESKTELNGLKKLPLKKLPTVERHEQQQGFDYSVMRVTWAFHATTHEPLTLYLPDLWITTTDGQRLRFPAQVHHISTKPLPDYLPAGLPVGTLTLQQSAITTPIRAAETALWNIRINTTALESTLPQQLPMLQSTNRYQLYHDRPRITTDATSADGLRHRATYNISLLPHQSGALTTPDIEINYFDSHLGILSTARLPGQQIMVGAALSNTKTAPNQPASGARATANSQAWWQPLALALGAGWLLSLAAFAVYAKKQRQQKRAAAPSLVPSPSAHTQKHCHPQQQLLLDAFASRTLQQGLQRWQQQHGDDIEISNCVKAVQKQCYGNGPTVDMQTVSTIATKICNTPPRTNNTPSPWHPKSFSRSIEQPSTQH